MKEAQQALRHLWQELYGNRQMDLLEGLFEEISLFKQHNHPPALPPEWYKDVVVYSLYVDLFNENFAGLRDKLPYLNELGVTCLWLLPILDSPMRDAGFDIRDYRHIRPELLPEDDPGTAFPAFLEEAASFGIRVIFDIAINHTSETHHWFQEALKSKENPYHDYYIWSEKPDKYLDARIIFQGIEDSNWTQAGDAWFFHRFFDFQPDLNYRNPRVLVEMCRNFLHWLSIGVDGFRADAIPYLWKEEGTDCENLPQTHLLVKFFRQVLDWARPHTLLLAEACQKPVEVVKYFGQGDECHAGYHFPLMPQLFKAIAAESAMPVIHTLHETITPPIPESSQWFTFLRCHDELSLELVYVSEEDRKYIHDHYCKQDQWNFRQGQGISARLSELMDRDPQKILLAYALMLSLPGTPVIYYGDEFGKTNDQAYYHQQIKAVGKDDTRFLVRGRIDWQELEAALKKPDSLAAQVFHRVKTLINVRNLYPAFGRGRIEWLKATDASGNSASPVLAFIRKQTDADILCLFNLAANQIKFQLEGAQFSSFEMIAGEKPVYQVQTNQWTLPGRSWQWIKIS